MLKNPMNVLHFIAAVGQMMWQMCAFCEVFTVPMCKRRGTQGRSFYNIIAYHKVFRLDSDIILSWNSLK